MLPLKISGIHQLFKDIALICVFNWLTMSKATAMKEVKSLLARSAFGVCSYVGQKMGLSPDRVRLYFIYASFVTLGSPVIVYLVMAFWLNVKKYIKAGRNLLWS
jgi:phage shock protein PspC (stress-responsive transcriptional regulator)